MSTTSRRPKWHLTQPPPPTPKILNFPRSRRTRRKQPKPVTQQYHHNNFQLVMHQDHHSSDKGRLEKLFDQENEDELPIVLLNSSSNASEVERRVRVEKEVEGEYCNGGGFEEEKWRFQAEILRAECNFLRMEREFAIRKLERNRVKMERTLRSAVQTLVSGKEKIFEGKNVNAVLEEEIEDLEEKLEELQKSSKIKDHEVRNCSNFDKEASLLQCRLEKLGGLSEEKFSKELQELAESSLSIKESCDLNPRTKNKCADMDVLRKKMEGLSKGVLDRVVEEEYASMLSSTANSSVASSASTSKRIYQCPDYSNFSARQLNQQEQTFQDENKCSGRCKAIIRKIVEQVRTETEQWSQMQEMLGQVRGEMEELRTSRDFWENRALNSDYEIQSLRHNVEEWKGKALSFENKANELQLQQSSVKEELHNRKAMAIPLGTQLESEKRVLSFCKENHCFDEKGCAFENVIKELNVELNKEQARNKDLPPISLGKHLAKEKRMLLRRLKETRRAADQDRKQDPLANERRRADTNGNGIFESKRSPLQDIGNSSLSPMARQHSKAVLSFLSPENLRMRDKP